MKIIADTNIPFVTECFSSIGQVELVSGREITPSIVKDADILLVRSVTRVDANLLQDSSVGFVGTATIGLDHIDIDFLRDNNIGFASAPGSNANSVAEYIVTALLEIAQKQNFSLKGKSIGVIGVGNVGSRVAEKCEALGMIVCPNDPPLKRQTDNEGYLPLDELSDCDFITLHTPLTSQGQDKTFHLANERFFKSLKTKSIFLNTSRGGVADTEALKHAIGSGKLRATVLDVWENEPDIDVELVEMADIVTPHIAGYSLDGKIAGLIMIYNAVCKYFDLEPKYEAGSFLPAPAIGQLGVDPTNREVLLKAVEKIYNIKEDDDRLRKILDQPIENRGEYFSWLRKNYPVRREFGNTQIVLKSKCDSISEKLAGIGFKVTDGR